MELFNNAKTIRLRSHHDKYLLASSDHESVHQDRNSGSPNARWTIEYVKSDDGILTLVRFRSCYKKYLFATDAPFLMGVTGKKVVQRSLPRRIDSAVEWEPIKDGTTVKLKTRYGNYLRANGGVPPWRNSVTHDVPSRSHTQDWILWRIEVLEVYEAVEVAPTVSVKVKASEEDEGELEPFTPELLRTPTEGNALPMSPNEGRFVRYNIVEDDGSIDHEKTLMLKFKGSGLEELKQVLEEETGLKDVVLCSQNPLNGKLNPLRLALPPHHVKMHVFLVSSTSKVAGDLEGPMTPTAP